MYLDVKEADRGEDDGQAFGVGWVKQTYDPEEESRIWRDSFKLVQMLDCKSGEG